jgi:hypothetical protein
VAAVAAIRTPAAATRLLAAERAMRVEIPPPPAIQTPAVEMRAVMLTRAVAEETAVAIRTPAAGVAMRAAIPTQAAAAATQAAIRIEAVETPGADGPRDQNNRQLPAVATPAPTRQMGGAGAETPATSTGSETTVRWSRRNMYPRTSGSSTTR